MKKDTYSLPNDFLGDLQAETHLLIYETEKSSAKNKVCFSQNLICLMLEGEKEIYCADTFSAIDNSSLFLLCKGNSLMTEKKPVFCNFRSILIFFSDDFLLDFMLKYKIERSTQLPPSPTGITVFEKDDFVRTFEQSLLLGKSVFQNEVFRTIKIHEILIYLLNVNTADMECFIQRALSKNNSFLLQKLVNSDNCQKLTIEEMAFIANMSVSTFKRKFLEIYHTTPKKYFIQKRMKKAEILLLNKQKPSDFYLNLGYENLSSFSHEFKKYFGVSPSAFAE